MADKVYRRMPCAESSNKLKKEKKNVEEQIIFSKQ